MQRKIIAVILALLLFAPFFETASADNSGICFTATSDTLLDLGSMVAFVSGTSYVSGKVFSTFGVYFNYSESSATAMLYSSSRQVYFELNTGKCYDNIGTTYTASAIYKNGQVYVPASWICTYFGLSSSYIKGIGYGDVLRIKNGGEALTDQQFLDAATSLMHNHYDEYFGVNNTVIPSPPKPEPTIDNNIVDDNTLKNASISLCFVGLPSETILDSLDNYSVNACFFVTAEEVKLSPDTIRRIYGSGHSIGIYSKIYVQKESEEAIAAIFEAAQYRPTLITSSDSVSKSCSEYAESNGFACFEPSIEIAGDIKYVSSMTSKLENSKGYVTVSMESNENTAKMLPYVLQYVTTKGFTVLPLRETYV